jgi:DNA-binding response OmpR family regulator
MIKSGDIVLTSGDLAHVSAVRDNFLSFEAAVMNATELCARPARAPTWIFVDWLLPEMSGLQLCGLLRDRINDHPLHMTMILPEADPRAQARALDAGADDYLIAPLTPACARAAPANLPACRGRAQGNPGDPDRRADDPARFASHPVPGSGRAPAIE